MCLCVSGRWHTAAAAFVASAHRLLISHSLLADTSGVTNGSLEEVTKDFLSRRGGASRVLDPQDAVWGIRFSAHLMGSLG